jgi:hypothetical protein
VGAPGPSPWELAWQVALFVYLDDFLFYWMHRALHQGWLFKRIHSVHHRIYTPWAITGHYMHPVEFVLTGSLMILGPLLVGSHLLTIFAWIVVRQWEAAEGHCGYALPWVTLAAHPGERGGPSTTTSTTPGCGSTTQGSCRSGTGCSARGRDVGIELATLRADGASIAVREKE